MESAKERTPSKPKNLPEYAEACLLALAAQGLGDKISLGGAIGLLHFIDYRSTKDVDAWWTDSATSEDQRKVVEVIATKLEAWGEVRQRAWGDVISVELLQEGRVVFAFQVARRSVQIESSAPVPWADVLLDSFSDLLASKMVALIERGAPRDFRDIYSLCQAALTTPQECWELWRRRQRLSGSDSDSGRAKLAVETHLARISQHRPLEQIVDQRQRAEAEKVRNWLVEEFLDVLR